MTALQLFPDEGTLRPPGTPEHAQPHPGHMRQCPQCNNKTLDYMSRTYAACQQQTCGYTWSRSAQLHYTEPIPF